MEIIDGRSIAATIESALQEIILKRRISLMVGSLFIGEATDSLLYTKRKQEAAKRLGVEFIVERLPSTVSPSEVEAKIDELNSRSSLDGYIIQLPLPGELRDETDKLLNRISPSKDADGLTNRNRRAYLDRDPKSFAPTPVAAVLTLLQPLFQPNNPLQENQYLQIEPLVLRNDFFTKKSATIISDGDVFGPTLQFALEAGGMRVRVERSDEVGLIDFLRESDLIVSAVGKPGFVTGDMVKSGAVVIDVGTTLVDGKTVGDVDWENVSAKAAAATPVPGGVGPVTVAMLFANALHLKLLR